MIRTVTQSDRVSAVLDTSALLYPRIYEQIQALEWKLARKPESGIPLGNFWVYRQGRPIKGVPELTVLYTYDDDMVHIFELKVHDLFK
jgi:hypothetical protein